MHPNIQLALSSLVLFKYLNQGSEIFGGLLSFYLLVKCLTAVTKLDFTQHL